MNCAVTAFKIDFNGTVGPCGSQGGCFNVGSQGAFAFTLVAFGMVQIRATKALGVASIDKTRQGLPIAVAQDDAAPSPRYTRRSQTYRFVKIPHKSVDL